MTALDAVILVDLCMRDNLYILSRPIIIVASRKTTNPQDFTQYASYGATQRKGEKKYVLQRKL